MLMLCIRLALLRVWRNRGNAFCQVLALSAILLPLLVLLGLKYGIVSGMKEQLLRNPAALEVHFSDIVATGQADAERYRAWPEVGFVLPCVSAAFSTIDVMNPAAAGQQSHSVEMTPTAAGDPLLLLGGTRIPGENEVVISEPLAKTLSLSEGGKIRLQVWRNSRQEILEREFSVAGVLPRQFCQRRMVYVPASYNVMVEEFVVHGKGEPHMPAEVVGSLYDGLILKGEKRRELAKMIQRAETDLQDSARPDFGALPQDTLLLHGAHLRFTANQMFPLLGYSVPGAEQPMLWVRPAELTLVDAAKRSRRVSISCAEQPAAMPKICAAPPCILVHPEDELAGQEVLLQMESPQGTSEFCCVAEAAPSVLKGKILASPPLMALLHAGQERLLIWHYREGGLRHPVVEFIALRMYASGLDEVQPLMEKLRAEGRDCRARLGAVRQVLQLEKNLDMLFLVLSVGAGIGGVLSFGMSLFNAVSLYRRDFALIQLMGAGRLSVSFIPVTEALVTTAVALLLSGCGFELIRRVIGVAFAGLSDAESICRLTPEHWLYFALLGLGVAWVASWASVLRVLRISPDEILRES